MSNSDNRKTVRLKKPNPLFESWLSEWMQHAESINSDTKHTFEKALGSLRKYPLVLSSGKECLILEHFDAALCIRLDRRLAEHKRDNSDRGGSISSSGFVEKDRNEDSKAPNHRKRKKEINLRNESAFERDSPKPKKKPYLPKRGTAPFALLATLSKNEQTNGSKDWMSKSELQRGAQVLCESSFTKPESGSFYTAWSSMSQLVTKGYVKKQSHPPKFSLTAEGREIAQKLFEIHHNELSGFEVQCDDVSSLLTAVTASDILAPGKKNQPKRSPVKKSRTRNVLTQESSESVSSQASSEADIGPEYFIPNSFDIILLVDTAETVGAEKKHEDETLRELNRLLVKFEVRKLNVGDFTWIARHRESGKELVLPYIVERKRLDDLAKSIKDGRFREQKFRLKTCGLKFLIYLVENRRGDYHGLPMDTLKFSIARTQIFDKFLVQIKRNHRESMLFLGQYTSILTELFEKKTLFCCKKEDMPKEVDIEDDIISLCTFRNFNCNIGKQRSFSVKEVFEKQLLQLHGVSPDMAWAIIQVYPSPYSLHRAYMAGGQNLLEDVRYGPLKRRVGPVISKTLHSFYTLSAFNN